MSPEVFISEILDSINLRSFTVGDDFRFGANREGDTNQLREWGKEKNILVENTETIIYKGERVSSTRIRKALANDDFKLAEELLGRPYTFSGKVVHGQHIWVGQLISQLQICGCPSKSFQLMEFMQLNAILIIIHIKVLQIWA